MPARPLQPLPQPPGLLLHALRSVAAIGLVIVLCALFGCASLPAGVERRASNALPADPAAPLSAVAADNDPGTGLSGLRLLADGDHALEARLTLIRRAARSIDLQTYHVAADGTGELVLAALRDAAARGVRVRLLVDDLYTAGVEPLLAALAAQPGAEVRLFNPLPVRGGSLAARVTLSLHEFTRINHRMHNKLVVVDGAFAIAGGRNVADEYYSRSLQANFVDMDVLATGAVVPELAALFDRYWNSEAAWPLCALVSDVPGVLPAVANAPAVGPDRFGVPSLQSQLDAGHLQQVVATVRVLADAPSKAEGRVDEDRTTQAQALRAMDGAEQSLLIVSPYFIPDPRAQAMLQSAVARDVHVTVLTNSLAATDEPAVHSGYSRHRKALLRMGVKLHELGAALVRTAGVPEVASGSLGRLHAKLAVIDQRLLLVGSMNMDRRSGRLNTEMALVIDSPELAARLADGLEAERRAGSYRLRLGSDDTVEWLSREHDREVVQHVEPDTSFGLRFRAGLTALLVSEELL